MKLLKLFSKNKKKSNPYALPIKANYSYYAQTLPRLLNSFNVFTPSFLDHISYCYSKNEPTHKFTDSDLLPGVERGYAAWVLNHCLLLVSARKSVIDTLANAKKIEAKYIDFDVFRPCKTCTKIPKKRRYRINSSIPVYPCEDCKEENICLFTYYPRW